MGQISSRDNGGLTFQQAEYLINRAKATLKPEQLESARLRGHLTLGGKLKELIIVFDGDEEWLPPETIIRGQ